MFLKIKVTDTKSVLYKAKGSKPRTSNKVTMKYLAGLQSIGNLQEFQKQKLNRKELKYCDIYEALTSHLSVLFLTALHSNMLHSHWFRFLYVSAKTPDVF